MASVMKRGEIAHMKVDLWCSGGAICGQTGNPRIVWGVGMHYLTALQMVTCKKCLRILRRSLTTFEMRFLQKTD